MKTERKSESLLAPGVKTGPGSRLEAGDSTRLAPGACFQCPSLPKQGYYLNKNIVAWRHFAVFGALLSMPMFLLSCGLRSLHGKSREEFNGLSCLSATLLDFWWGRI